MLSILNRLGKLLMQQECRHSVQYVSFLVCEFDETKTDLRVLSAQISVLLNLVKLEKL